MMRDNDIPGGQFDDSNGDSWFVKIGNNEVLLYAGASLWRVSIPVVGLMTPHLFEDAREAYDWAVHWIATGEGWPRRGWSDPDRAPTRDKLL